MQRKFRPNFIFALLSEGECKTGRIELYRKDYIKTRLQRISGDTSKNFVLAVIRYIDIAKFVILYNEFVVLHNENKPGTMIRC